MDQLKQKWNTSYKPLIIGYLLSAVLLFTAYFVVVERVFKGWILLLTVLGIGTLQALIQLVLFLHVGVEEKPRWNLLTFLFMVLIIVILLGGSLWIMYNLDYNMMLLM